MKKALFTLMCLLAMMMTGTGLKAQEISVALSPGWTWIGYPKAETMSITAALGDFVPLEGDQLKSKQRTATYTNGRWRGTLSSFTPGLGYKYYSNREVPVNLVLGGNSTLAVSTATPASITCFGLTCGGEVTNEGNSAVIVRGVCYSTQQNPTIADPHTTDGYGIGGFTSVVEGLEMNTGYYVRAYALTANGTSYGEQKMFTTKNGLPVLTTMAASEIGTTWATCGGDVSDDGGMEITERGICWGTNHNPTVEGNHGANGAGLGSFSVNMSGLEPNTIYYVRAYATNGHTTAYGNEVSFRTEVAQTWPNGKLPGQFSVSATHQVQFSQGNLQYIGSASPRYWKFAEHQWDYLGNNGQGSSSSSVDRDLLGWGTSGYNHGATAYQPWSTSTTSGDYDAYGNSTSNLCDGSGQADWGYNAIRNGGAIENFGWRTLTSDEWIYVFNTRTASTVNGVSNARYAKAMVADVKGVLLFPDKYVHPATVAQPVGINQTGNAGWNGNSYSADDFAKMQANGAVFLPAAGDRNGTTVTGVGSTPFGNYWSSSHVGNNNASRLYFYSTYLSMLSDSRYKGFSVRLVCPVE